MLYLIDTPNWIHRARHGPGEFAPTLEGMLSAFLKRASPPYLAAVWGSRGPSFRDELLESYREGHTPIPDEELRDAREVFLKLRIAVVDPIPGAEADDMIVTLALRAVRETARAVILSTNLAFVQAVRENVFLASRRGEEKTLYTPRLVRETWGVRPEQWPDVLALCGKKSHGIPGVPKIGQAGACKLIAQFGDLESLLKRYRQVERKQYRRALEGHAEDARLSLKLARLRSDLPVEFDLKRFARG